MFDPTLLAETFSLATFGNGIAAILAGILSSLLTAGMGYTSPFMMAFVCLVLGSLIINMTWNENFGDSRSDIKETFLNAVKTLKTGILATVLDLSL